MGTPSKGRAGIKVAGALEVVQEVVASTKALEGSPSCRTLMVPASSLASLVNAYTIDPGPPKTIIVPKASQLAALQDVTVAGTLLKKQTIAFDPATGQRTTSLGANGGAYQIEADGDLHFCLGARPLQPHITCEVQHAAAWLAKFQASIGQPITASGLFRCLFEHPGFDTNDDAHIFEMHPVYAASPGGTRSAFDVGLPDPKSIHTWLLPRPLNVQDGRIQVAYDARTDVLSFTGMDGQDENYVRVPGTLSNVRPSPAGTTPAAFTLTSPDIGHPIQGIALSETNAAKQLVRLRTSRVKMVGLRGIDLAQALAGRYVIRLLAIDIQPGS